MLNRLLRPPLDGAISLAPQERAPMAPRGPTDPRVGEGGGFGAQDDCSLVYLSFLHLFTARSLKPFAIACDADVHQQPRW